MLQRRLKEPFGKAGLIVAVFALVFAMLGGAYAATGGNGGATATASGKKSSKGKQGKQGKTGKTGPAGPAGPTGPAGAPGAKGDAGAAGSNGTNGTNGTPGAKGEKGENGVTGFTETLPSKKTETGVWSATVHEDSSAATKSSLQKVPISFPIPVPPLGARGLAFFLDQEETEEEAATGGCTGSALEPTAPPGTLCVYTAEGKEETKNYSQSAEIVNAGVGYRSSGAFLYFFPENEAEPAALVTGGAWAVTAP